MKINLFSQPKAALKRTLGHVTSLGLEFSSSHAQKLIGKQLAYVEAIKESRLTAAL